MSWTPLSALSRDGEEHLPIWLRADDVLTDAGHEFARCQTRAAHVLIAAGDSYTANLVIIDEADLAL